MLQVSLLINIYNNSESNHYFIPSDLILMLSFRLLACVSHRKGQSVPIIDPVISRPGEQSAIRVWSNHVLPHPTM